MRRRHGAAPREPPRWDGDGDLPSPSKAHGPGHRSAGADAFAAKRRRLLLRICLAGCLLCALGTFVLNRRLSHISEGRRNLLTRLVRRPADPSASQESPDVANCKPSKVDYLLSLFGDLPPATATSSFVPVPYAYRRKREVPRDYITLTTQMSVEKFERLVLLLERWNGPISCAVYITDEYDIHHLDALVQGQGDAFRDWVTLHVLLEKKPVDPNYPVNAMRNLALFNIETEYFLLLDVDFMTSKNAHDYLYNFFAYNHDPGRFSALYVIPAFDVLGPLGRQERPDISDVPWTKRELVSMLPSKQVKPFHSYFEKGQRKTDYARWYECKDLYYEIGYEYQYEPYVVGAVHAIHRFDERFRGFGRNKVTWIHEAHLRDYKLVVLCDLFVAHLYHPGRTGRKWSTRTQKLATWYEQTYWPARYQSRAKGEGHLGFDADEYRQYTHSKEKQQKCQRKYDHGDMSKLLVSPAEECLQPVCEFVESAILWSLVGGRKNGALGPDEQWAILLEAEEHAVVFFSASQHGEMKCAGEGEEYPLRDLIADLYLNMGVVQKKRHAFSQSASCLMKAMRFGSSDLSEEARTILSQLPGQDADQMSGRVPGPRDFYAMAADATTNLAQKADEGRHSLPSDEKDTTAGSYSAARLAIEAEKDKVNMTWGAPSEKGRAVPIYWINLDESLERKEAILKMLSSLDHHRVSAADVNTVLNMWRAEHLIFHPDIVLRNNTQGVAAWKDHARNIYHYKEAACLLSHLWAVKWAFDDGKDIALIVEDDALITREFLDELLGYTKKAPMDWKILQFATNRPDVIEQGIHLSDPFVSWQEFHYGTRAYLINRVGMRTLLNKVHSTSNGRDIWRIGGDVPMVVADEVIYAMVGDAYTATGLWVEKLNFQSTVQSVEGDASRANLHTYSSLVSADDRRNQLVRKIQPSSFQESLLLLMNIRVANDDDIEREIRWIKQDNYAVCQYHRICDWKVRVVLSDASLRETFEQEASDVPSNIHFDTEVSSKPFNKFAHVRRSVDRMADYDLVLFKDNDQRISGLPWRTLLEKKGNAVLAAPLRQSAGEATKGVRFHRKPRQWFQIHEVNQWLHSPTEWSSELFTKVVPLEVPLLEMYFVLLDGRFGKYFFGTVLSQEFVNQPIAWGLDLMWCQAAADWDSSRPGCHLVPVVSIHEDTRQIDKRGGFKEEGHQELESFNNDPDFRRWVKASFAWRQLVGGRSLKEIEKECRSLLGLNKHDLFDLERCIVAVRHRRRII